jgi:hypothetical protein
MGGGSVVIETEPPPAPVAEYVEDIPSKVVAEDLGDIDYRSWLCFGEIDENNPECVSCVAKEFCLKEKLSS